MIVPAVSRTGKGSDARPTIRRDVDAEGTSHSLLNYEFRYARLAAIDLYARAGQAGAERGSSERTLRSCKGER